MPTAPHASKLEAWLIVAGHGATGARIWAFGELVDAARTRRDFTLLGVAVANLADAAGVPLALPLDSRKASRRSTASWTRSGDAAGTRP